jgi:hypothetical protein
LVNLLVSFDEFFFCVDRRITSRPLLEGWTREETRAEDTAASHCSLAGENLCLFHSRELDHFLCACLKSHHFCSPISYIRHAAACFGPREV